VAHGQDLIAVASVVESDSSARSIWFVRVANPPDASGVVSFRARAMCMGVSKVPVLEG
jgi:hypothetical protein